MHKSIRGAFALAALTLSLGSVAQTVALSDDPDQAASAYVDSVRDTLNKAKRFPTGREISIEQPSGRTQVAFTLARSGKVAAVKTTQSSEVMALDEMGRELVHRAHYPAFPAAAWAGSATHDFVVTYNFARTPKGTVTVGEPVEVSAR